MLSSQTIPVAGAYLCANISILAVHDFDRDELTGPELVPLVIADVGASSKVHITAFDNL
eukprot:SAG11_NODE_3241_length_2589_cov_1.544578_2_plen_59_part_00